MSGSVKPLQSKTSHFTSKEKKQVSVELFLEPFNFEA